MPRPITIEYNGQQVSGRSMQFEATREIWNEYKLENGAIVKLRVVPADIVLTDEPAPTGEPLVVVKAGLLIQYIPDAGGQT